MTPGYDREADLLDQIIGTTPGREGVAIRLGWECMHLRPARTLKGWRTPVQGSLGKGWPDLILIRVPRIIAAELKSARGKVSDEQAHVLAQLRLSGVEVHVWRPADWDSIVEALA